MERYHRHRSVLVAGSNDLPSAHFDLGFIDFQIHRSASKLLLYGTRLRPTSVSTSSNQLPAARTEVKQGEFFNCRRIDAHSFYSHSQGLRFGTLLTAVAATAAAYRD
jgi:hypothetical protein